MSWVQWQDEIWPSTDDVAELELMLWPPDASCPRQNWSIDLHHRETVWSEEHKMPVPVRSLEVQISDLHFFENDWTLLSSLEIRADSKWHEKDYITEYGALEAGEIGVTFWDNRSGKFHFERWTGHEFTLRFGKRDGTCFPCELEGWLLPEKEYYQTEPESRRDVTRFSEEPPNLRVITPVFFNTGRIMMPRCGDDPVPAARRYLKEMTNCELMFRSRVHWDSNYLPGHKEFKEPGWASNVVFATKP